MTTEDTEVNDGDGEQFECPWEGCDYTSHSSKGVKVHHKRLHGESIRPQHECENCGATFFASPYDVGKYCSTKCRDEGQKKRIEDECDWCGDVYEIRPCHEGEIRFCSTECTDKWRSERYSGKGNNNYKQKVVVECDWCGEEMERIPSQSNYDTHFCSQDHLAKWRRENYPTGQEHHLWRGGYNTYHAVRNALGDLSWNTVRKRARERDNYTCQMCGGEDATPVHHIIPLLAGGTNDQSLLTVLCEKCHPKAETKTRELTEPHLVDWSDEELPEGRERWIPGETIDDTAATTKQATFVQF